MRMLSSPLRRYGSNGSLYDLQESLLYALAGYVSCDRRIFRLSRDLVDLVNINDPVLCPLDISVRGLNHFQEDVLHIFSHISCLCKSCRVCDRKRNVQDLRKCLGQQRLSASCRPEHEDIALLELHTEILLGHDPLIMVVHCHREDFLRLILSDYIIIQKFFHLLRRQEIDIIICSAFIIIQLFLNDLGADGDALVTDVCAVGSGDQFSHLCLRLVAERAPHDIIHHFSCHILHLIPTISVLRSLRRSDRKLSLPLRT